MSFKWKRIGNIIGFKKNIEHDSEILKNRTKFWNFEKTEHKNIEEMKNKNSHTKKKKKREKEMRNIWRNEQVKNKQGKPENFRKLFAKEEEEDVQRDSKVVKEYVEKLFVKVV